MRSCVSCLLLSLLFLRYIHVVTCARRKFRELYLTQILLNEKQLVKVSSSAPSEPKQEGGSTLSSVMSGS